MKISLALFATFWIAIVAVADGAMTYQIHKAVRSGNWLPTEGTVTRSELKYGRKNSVSLDLAYSYAVGGRTFTGRDYQYSPAVLPSRKWPAVKDQLPVAKSVKVYYNPAAPDQAVLNPGLEPDVLLLALFLTPFNVVAVFLIGLCWTQFTGRLAFDPTRHVRPTVDGAGYAARLNGPSPLSMFGLSLLIVSFVSIFVVVLLVHSVGSVPSSWLLDGAIWLAILCLCGAIAWRYRTPREFIEGMESVTLPNTSTGRAVTEIPRSLIQAVRVEVNYLPARRRPQEMHVVALLWQDESEKKRVTRFAEYADRRAAEALAEWVLERLGLVTESVT